MEDPPADNFEEPDLGGLDFEQDDDNQAGGLDDIQFENEDEKSVNFDAELLNEEN